MRFLDDAISDASRQRAWSNNALKDALLNRLELRRGLLAAVTLDDTGNKQIATFWQHCVDLLPTLSSSNKLGVSVESAFSIKIQRGLASSVPPRPIVNVSFKDAFTYLSRLCLNGRDAYQIFEYDGGSHLQVCQSLSVLKTVLIRETRHLGGRSILERLIHLCTFVACCSH